LTVATDNYYHSVVDKNCQVLFFDVMVLAFNCFDVLCSFCERKYNIKKGRVGKNYGTKIVSFN